MKSFCLYTAWITRITNILILIGVLFFSGSLANASSVVLSFGSNHNGQTGLGVTDGNTLIATPIDTTNLAGTTITQVAAGDRHSLLVTADGSVFAFGENNNWDGRFAGQLGLGTTTDASVATPIDTTNLIDRTVTNVAGGESHTLLVADGTAFSCGSNSKGRTGLGLDDNSNTLIATPIDVTNLAGATVTQTSAGTKHSLLVTSDGEVYSFGDNDRGATGLGTTRDHTLVATTIDTTHLEGKTITQVAAGELFSLILDDDGVVYSFGTSDRGQCGLGPLLGTTIAMPIDTTNLEGKTITQVAAGSSHSLILADDGTVFLFGANRTVATPIDTTNLAGKTITKVAAGDRFSLLLADDGTVFSSCQNGEGRTGLGTDFGSTPIPTPIDTTHLAGPRVTDIAAGGYHGLLLAVPIPEPSTFALLSIGAVGLLCRVRRRRP